MLTIEQVGGEVYGGTHCACRLSYCITHLTCFYQQTASLSFRQLFREKNLYFIGREVAPCHFPEFSIERAHTDCLTVPSVSTIGCRPFSKVFLIQLLQSAFCLFLIIQITHEHIIEKVSTIQIKVPFEILSPEYPVPLSQPLPNEITFSV